MIRIRGRIERLEQEISPPDAGPPEVLTICFVDADKKIVSTLDFPLGHIRPQNGRRWRTERGSRSWRGR